jgi:hypothetical protein
MTRIVLLLLLAGFHQPPSFEAPAGDGGGNRMYFDGSPRGKAYDCSACHDRAAGTIAAQIDFTPSADGAYTPGTAYTVTVTLAGEHAGFGTANNQNGFVAEFVHDDRTVAGTLAPPASGVTQTIDDGKVIAGEGKAATSWTFTWTAPPAGAVTLYLGMVDGNGAASVTVPQNDPGGDDVATARVRLCESAPGCDDAPAPPPKPESAAAGCSAGGAPGLLIALAALLVRRRRALAVLLAGCASPTVPGDCPDHVCGIGGADGGNGCAENWACTAWDSPIGSDQATRTCVDLANAGTTDCKPATNAKLPALDLDFYKCNVHPIFQRGCGQLACHGTDTGHPFRVYTRGRFRNDELVPDRGSCLTPAGTPENLQDKGTGTIMCEGWYPHTEAEWWKSFDSSRSFMLDVATTDDSLLLREPAKGGLPHAQVKLFGAGDADYQTIRTWLGGASLGRACNTGSN